MRKQKRSVKALPTFGKDTIMLLEGLLETESIEVLPSSGAGPDGMVLQIVGTDLSEGAYPLEVEVDVALAPGEWVNYGVYDVS